MKPHDSYRPSSSRHATKGWRFLRTSTGRLLLLAAGIPSVLAVPPQKIAFSFSAPNVLTGVCPFSVNIESTVTGTETLYFDKNGALTRIFIHQTEQDTFSANGKTLIGIPFTFNIEAYVDSTGNITLAYADGVAEKIPLPDGSLFISAGRIDLLNHPGAAFILSPDKGNPGDVAAFCAALSP